MGPLVAVGGYDEGPRWMLRVVDRVLKAKNSIIVPCRAFDDTLTTMSLPSITISLPLLASSSFLVSSLITALPSRVLSGCYLHDSTD